MSAIVRTKHEHKRVIVDAQLKPKGIGDGGVFTNMVLPVFDAHPEIRGVGYDMALYATDQDRILDTGRHVLVKTPLINRGKRSFTHTGSDFGRAFNRYCIFNRAPVNWPPFSE